MVITNTTSVILFLNNFGIVSKETTKLLQDRDVRHLNLQPVGMNIKPSRPVSLMVQLDGERVYRVEDAEMIVKIVEDLDPQKTYSLRIIHMGGPRSTEGVLEFEGIWVNRSNSMGAQAITSTTSPTQSGLEYLLPLHGSLDDDQQSGLGAPCLTKPVIEIVTAETPKCDVSKELTPDALQKNMEERSGFWYNRLKASLRVDTVVIPTADVALMPSEQSAITVSDLYFRSGPPGTMHFPRPWSFKSYYPSVLILQIGFVDFVDFFSDKKNHNKHALAKFTNDFVDTYIKFIKTIRTTAYPFDSTSRPASSAKDSNDDRSYIYNSAPSTLPIFLITPFAASDRFVTRKLKLDRVISDALSQVSMAVQAQGDKSTFWIDTTGWLDHRKDFHPEYFNNTTEPTPVNSFGSFKVASLLADHICPYVQRNNVDMSEKTRSKRCPFDRYDNYLGNVYLPKDVEFDRAVLERKIEMIKEKFNMQGGATDSSEL